MRVATLPVHALGVDDLEEVIRRFGHGHAVSVLMRSTRSSQGSSRLSRAPFVCVVPVATMPGGVLPNACGCHRHPPAK